MSESSFESSDSSENCPKVPRTINYRNNINVYNMNFKMPLSKEYKPQNIRKSLMIVEKLNRRGSKFGKFRNFLTNEELNLANLTMNNKNCNYNEKLAFNLANTIVKRRFRNFWLKTDDNSEDSSERIRLEEEKIRMKEKERLEKLRKEKEEKERLEREKIERERKEREEKEKKRREEEERREREKREREKREKEKREKKEREKREKKEKEDKERKEKEDKERKEKEENYYMEELDKSRDKNPDDNMNKDNDLEPIGPVVIEENVNEENNKVEEEKKEKEIENDDNEVKQYENEFEPIDNQSQIIEKNTEENKEEEHNDLQPIDNEVKIEEEENKEEENKEEENKEEENKENENKEKENKEEENKENEIKEEDNKENEIKEEKPKIILTEEEESIIQQYKSFLKQSSKKFDLLYLMHSKQEFINIMQEIGKENEVEKSYKPLRNVVRRVTKRKTSRLFQTLSRISRASRVDLVLPIIEENKKKEEEDEKKSIADPDRDILKRFLDEQKKERDDFVNVNNENAKTKKKK